MAKPISKKYGPDDERVATFRITHGKLTAFQQVCESQGLSMSESLIRFIDSVLGGSEIPRPVTGQSIDRSEFEAIAKQVSFLSRELEDVKYSLGRE